MEWRVPALCYCVEKIKKYIAVFLTNLNCCVKKMSLDINNNKKNKLAMIIAKIIVDKNNLKRSNNPLGYVAKFLQVSFIKKRYYKSFG